MPGKSERTPPSVMGRWPCRSVPLSRPGLGVPRSVVTDKPCSPTGTTCSPTGTYPRIAQKVTLAPFLPPKTSPLLVFTSLPRFHLPKSLPSSFLPPLLVFTSPNLPPWQLHLWTGNLVGRLRLRGRRTLLSIFDPSLVLGRVGSQRESPVG